MCIHLNRKKHEINIFRVSFVVFIPDVQGGHFPDILRCPTITEIIDGEEVTRPVNMDTCQEPREVNVGNESRPHQATLTGE